VTLLYKLRLAPCRALRAFPVWETTEMEMDLAFKPGDVVQLNSVGRPRTRARHGDDELAAALHFKSENRIGHDFL
jgi:hypothetical protein